ncbi:MAG: hypothetical protein H6868_01080 [Rhodospirillales bacterium]|nr:hypothetical protein [Rhodospirillales bacterium]
MTQPVIALASSTKFYDETKEYVRQLQDAGFTVHHPAFEFDDAHDQTITQKEKESLTFRFLDLLDETNILYVVAKDGYVGYSVTIEIAYAYAKGLSIYSSESIREMAVNALVAKALPFTDFLDMVRSGDS